MTPPAPAATCESIGWRCFHCDEVFTTRDAAGAHFGDDEMERPACQLAATEKGLVGLVREQARELDRLRQEDGPSHRDFFALGVQAEQDRRRAEEQGYAKALADIEAGKIEPAHATRLLHALKGFAP